MSFSRRTLRVNYIYNTHCNRQENEDGRKIS